MKEIPLTQGKVALVDDSDWSWLSHYNWCAIKQVESTGTSWYAGRSIRCGTEVRIVYMHREILCVPAELKVDHRDGDGLNNRRLNLRPATSEQNSQNQKKRQGCSSRLKGVCWHRKAEKWQAAIRVHGHLQYLGLFASESEAGVAYANAAKHNHGEYARYSA